MELKKILTTGALISLVGIFNGCDNPRIEYYDGKVIKEQFTPDTGGFFNKIARYEMLVESSNGNKEVINFYGEEARFLSLRYDIEDSIKVEKKIHTGIDKGKITYKILDN